MGFTETEPWSSNFEWLSYESINFIEGMGSLIIFVWVAIVLSVFQLAGYVLSCHTKSKCCSKLIRPRKFCTLMIGMTTGIMFTALICISISMRLLQFWPFLNRMDFLSIAFQMLVVAVLVCYIVMLVYFSFVIAPYIVKKSQIEQLTQNKDVLRQLRDDFKVQYKKRKEVLRQNILMSKMASLEANSLILSRHKRHQEQTESLKESKEKERNTEIYAPFMSNVRHSSIMCFMWSLILNLRRMSTLYLAMFMPDWVLVYLFVFGLGTLVMAVYLIHFSPFSKTIETRLQVLNESFVMSVTYLVIALLIAKKQEDQSIVGSMICYVIYVSTGINALIVLTQIVQEIKTRVKRCCAKRSQKQKFNKAK